MRDHYANHPLRDIISEIWDLLLQDWNMEIRHTPSDNISCADYMAKLGQLGHDTIDAVDVVLIPTIPKRCLHMFLKDQLACNRQFNSVIVLRTRLYDLVSSSNFSNFLSFSLPYVTSAKKSFKTASFRPNYKESGLKSMTGGSFVNIKNFLE